MLQLHYGGGTRLADSPAVEGKKFFQMRCRLVAERQASVSLGVPVSNGAGEGAFGMPGCVVAAGPVSGLRETTLCSLAG